MENILHAGLVYESPDKGKSVYVRNAGEVSRKPLSSLVSTTDDDLWRNILEAGKTNSALREAIDVCIQTYKLSTECHDV